MPVVHRKKSSISEKPLSEDRAKETELKLETKKGDVINQRESIVLMTSRRGGLGLVLAQKTS